MMSKFFTIFKSILCWISKFGVSLLSKLGTINHLKLKLLLKKEINFIILGGSTTKFSIQQIQLAFLSAMNKKCLVFNGVSMFLIVGDRYTLKVNIDRTIVLNKLANLFKKNCNKIYTT